MKKFLEVLAALAALAAFGWDPPRHDGTFTRDGVTYVQYGGLSQESYVVTNVAVAGGGGLDTNAVERIANMAVETNATITAHAEAIVTNAAEIAAIPRITESPTNPGWAANAEGAWDAVNATYASMAERLGNYKEDDLSEMENAISSHSSQLFQQSQSIADNAVAIAAETVRAIAAETAAVHAATNYTDAATNALSLSVSHPTSLWSDADPKSAGCTNRLDSFGNLYKAETVVGGFFADMNSAVYAYSGKEGTSYRYGGYYKIRYNYVYGYIDYYRNGSWVGIGQCRKGLNPLSGDDISITNYVESGYSFTFTPQGAPAFSPTPYDRFARASELPEVGTNAVLAANAYTDAATNAVAQSVAAETDRATAAETAMQSQIDLFKSFTAIVTNSLPETGEDGCVYLVPIAGTENKAEWLWIHEPSNHWEKIGTTAIDMAEYAKATELSAHAEDRNNPHGVTAEQVGAVALVEDREGGKTAVTIGSRTDEQMASEYKIGARSLSAGLDNVAAGESSVAFGSYCFVFGDNSIATGNGSTAEGINAFASGYYSTAAEDGSVAFAGGRAGGENSFAMGSTVRQGDDYAFTWGTGSYQGDYRSHGPRTFNIDPLGGLDGLWVGETNMAAHIGAAVATTLTNSDATAWAEASATNSIAYLATHAQGGGGLDIRYDAVSNLFYIIVK